MNTLTICTNKVVLSDKILVYKTERFLRETDKFRDINIVISKIAESIILNQSIGMTEAGCFVVRIHENNFFLKLSETEIVFYNYHVEDAFIRKGDARFSDYFKNPTFSIELDMTNSMPNDSDFLKLYRVTGADDMYFPRLDELQGLIVAIEDSNVLVQGVAGSGKTNLCIDKIVHSAARGYVGRTMYSTFSRGLLTDTKMKIADYVTEIKHLICDIEEKRVVFCADDHSKAVENKLGIRLPANNMSLVVSLRTVADYLENKVDFMLIEDIYKKHINSKYEMANETFFVNKFVKDIKNHQLKARLERLAHLSYEVIYKEIFGLIGGCCDPGFSQKTLTTLEYTQRRKDSFSATECETIFLLARDFFEYMQKNGLTDNNFMSRELLESSNLAKYSLVVLDEVQDMTEVNLVLFKSITMKMFCVGDALQMINASYFSFSYLKRLLYEKDISSVAELVSNYRSTKKIADITEELAQLNAQCFGVHNFVLKNKSMHDGAKSEVAFVNDKGFIDALGTNLYNNYTIVVAGQKEREQLRNTLKKQEILTVAEIKGLERETVVLYNLLSSNQQQWQAFARMNVNRKNADENSVFRYYFNLLYVGISRARTRLYVSENQIPDMFATFISRNFESLSTTTAINNLTQYDGKIEAEQDEILSRVKEFIKLEQYENARFAANQILSVKERTTELRCIDINEKFIKHGNHRDAGVGFLQYGMYDEAKTQFNLTGDQSLVGFVDACVGAGDTQGLEALSMFTDMDGNETVQKVIVDLVRADLQNMTNSVKMASVGLAKIKSQYQSVSGTRRKKNG